MNGILNILKPPGMTSFDVVGYLRSIFKIKKIGHTGTLDPAAAGVLPVCIGQATKTIEFLIEKDKIYRAEITLGVKTDTLDSTGEVVESKKVNLSDETIIKAIKSFEGGYEQIPPMYSAIKVGGKKLYELAREGITIERKSRRVDIYSIDIINIKDSKVIFDVKCSKGTYIRSLCDDIGEKLGCGGHMSFLIRKSVGNFNISNTLTLEDVKEFYHNGRINEKLIEIDKVLDKFETLQLTEKEQKKFLNGVIIRIDKDKFNIGDFLRIYGTEQEFIAIAKVLIRENEYYIKSEKIFKNI